MSNNLYIDRCSLVSRFLEETFETYKIIVHKMWRLASIYQTHLGHLVTAVNEQDQWKTTAGFNTFFKNKLMSTPISLGKSLNTSTEDLGSCINYKMILDICVY